MPDAVFSPSSPTIFQGEKPFDQFYLRITLALIPPLLLMGEAVVDTVTI